MLLHELLSSFLSDLLPAKVPSAGLLHHQDDGAHPLSVLPRQNGVSVVPAPNPLELGSNHSPDLVDLPIPFAADVASEHFLNCLGRHVLPLLEQLLLEHQFQALVIQLAEVLLLLLGGESDPERITIDVDELTLDLVLLGVLPHFGRGVLVLAQVRLELQFLVGFECYIVLFEWIWKLDHFCALVMALGRDHLVLVIGSWVCSGQTADVQARDVGNAVLLRPRQKDIEWQILEVGYVAHGVESCEVAGLDVAALTVQCGDLFVQVNDAQLVGPRLPWVNQPFVLILFESFGLRYYVFGVEACLQFVNFVAQIIQRAA